MGTAFVILSSDFTHKVGISYQFTGVLLFGIKSNDGDLRWLLNFDEHFTCHLRFSSHKED